MKTYISAQGRIAVLRKLQNGKYSVRIADKFKKPMLAEIAETRNDAEALICLSGECWTEMMV